uniref:Uncharacterized protein n=1 Tax=Oryza brachyantha TaxID=4533 RepID=J3ND11_ORYBR
MVNTGEPSLAATTPGDDAAATAAVRFAGFRRERGKAGCATRAAERNKRRALHQVPMAPTPVAAPSPAVLPTLDILGATPNPAASLSSSILAAAMASAAITPSPTSTRLFAFTAASSPMTGPISSTLLTAIVLSPVPTPSSQVTSPCVGGAPMTTVHAKALKKERSRAAAATRIAERKNRRVMKQRLVVRNQAAKPTPAARSAPSFVDAALSWADVMSPCNAPSLQVRPALVDMDQPSTADMPIEGVTLELSLSILG